MGERPHTSIPDTPAVGGWRPLVMPLALLFVLGIPVLTTWMGFRETDRRTASGHAQIIADQAAFRLEEYVEARLFTLQVIRRDFERDGADRDDFLARSQAVREELGGFRAINWIDVDGVIRWVSPLASNERAVGRNVFEHPVAGRFLTRARAEGEPTMTSPLDLFQGGRAFTAYVPVRSGGRELIGYVNGVFLLDPLVRTSLEGGVLDQYNVLLTDGDEPLFGNWPAGGIGEDQVSGLSTVHLLNRTWTVRVTPRPGAALPVGAPNLIFLVGGIALAVSMAILLYAVLRNQEERRRASHERRVLEMRLRHSQKMEAIGLLAGGVAHDFNNVLTAVLGNADLALGAAPEKREQYLQNIREACSRASQLTGQLLTFSRKQVVVTERLDLTREVEAQRTFIQPLVREDVFLKMDLDPEAGIVDVNASHVSQVLMNLLVNALDALPHGGELYVQTRQEAVSPRGEAGPWSVLEVRDTGIGMPEDVRARVLEPFFTTKEPGKGTGLGLATVYGIATGAGGFVSIDSEPNAGTRVMVWFPTTTEEVRTEREMPEETPLSLAGTVLVVEDEQGVRDVIARLLRQEDLVVLEASDGQEALEHFESGADIDVVVTDSVMPRLGGLSLIRKLRERGLDTGAVICSGYAENVGSTELRELDAVFLEKPFKHDALRKIVLGRLRRRTPARA